MIQQKLPRCGLGLIVLLTILSGCRTSSVAQADAFDSAFAVQGLTGWQQHHFRGQTEYVTSEQDGGTVVVATADGSATMLYRPVVIDLATTPQLSWRWKVIQTPDPDNQYVRQGDDFAARIYVAFNGSDGVRALNYVWSNDEELRSWPSPYNQNSIMIALRSGATSKGEWYHESVNIANDFARHFAEVPSRIDAVAIMTDADNTGGSAVAVYGDISISAE